MPSILEELRERVKQSGAALEEAKKATAKAQAKQATLDADLRAYTMALEAEERRNGVAGAVKVIPAEHIGRPDLSALANSGEPSVNKSEEVRRVLKERKQGITPIALHDELQKQGVDIGANYVYALLHKLKKRGLVKKKGTKFYWVETQEIATARG
jgi:hypothetical protein